MGMLERFRTPVVAPWRPPVYGACLCPDHVEDLLDREIPRGDGSGSVTVAALATSGALITVPTPGRLFVDDPLSGERRGPFHWRVLHQGRLHRFRTPDAPITVDDALFVQPHIERVLHVENEGVEGAGVLAVGAPRLCARGVQAALVLALSTPRLRG